MRVIEQPFRAGFGANHNRVIGETSGRYVVLLSHDAEPEPGALAALVAFADAHPRAAVVAPRLRYPDGSPQANAWRFPSPAVAALGTLTLGRVGVVQSRGEEPRRVDWAMGAALLLRRAALDEVGLFDESYFMFSEETDLCLRLARAGWETWFEPGAVVVHHDSALRDEVPSERIAEEWRSRHRYWRAHHSAAGARVAAAATAAPVHGARRHRRGCEPRAGGLLRPELPGPDAPARALRLARSRGPRPARAGRRVEPPACGRARIRGAVKILLVAMYFPPAGGAGVQRPLKLSRHLADLGFEVHVVAPDNPKWVYTDPSLRIPENITVHRVANHGPRARIRSEELAGASTREQGEDPRRGAVPPHPRARRQRHLVARRRP